MRRVGGGVGGVSGRAPFLGPAPGPSQLSSQLLRHFRSPRLGHSTGVSHSAARDRIPPRQTPTVGRIPPAGRLTVTFAPSAAAALTGEQWVTPRLRVCVQVGVGGRRRPAGRRDRDPDLAGCVRRSSGQDLSGRSDREGLGCRCPEPDMLRCRERGSCDGHGVASGCRATCPRQRGDSGSGEDCDADRGRIGDLAVGVLHFVGEGVMGDSAAACPRSVLDDM